jgi:hypothetical protein
VSSQQWDEDPGSAPIPGEPLSGYPPLDGPPPVAPAVAEDELSGIAVDWLQTNVLRLLVTRVVPLMLGSGLVTGAGAWAQDALGVDLPTEVVASIVLPVVVGVVVILFAYVRNHSGATKLGTAVLELQRLRELGQQQLREIELRAPDQHR